MGRKLDLSGLTEQEAEHVLLVVQRDMKLRKKEEERLSELRMELEEEGSRCLLLSRQSRFNQRCCIRCCAPFTLLLNPRRRCQDCHHNVCRACRAFSKRDQAWLCSTCQKRRLFKTQSLEWFYTNVKCRFKRFGSAKVLKTLYRKHLSEHSALSELTEGSTYTESVYGGSICGSDSTFYRQSEEHSMAETLSVAMRVAEEALDEAISKAEFDQDNQEKQNEAHYLRQHRGELAEELTKTIVDKIINQRKTLAEMKPDHDKDWPPDIPPHQPTSGRGSQPSLRRSHSALSLLDNDSPELISEVSKNQTPPLGLKKEGGASAVSTWKSVERLDNSMLKSSDGNWIALQSAQLSRPSLLTRRKSLVYSALEKESSVVSAYEGMESDNEAKPDPDGSSGAPLRDIFRRIKDSNLNIQEALGARLGNPSEHPSDSEAVSRHHRPLLALLKRKVPPEMRRPSSSRRTSIINVNFNPEGPGGESSSGDDLKESKVRRSDKKRSRRKEQAPFSSSLPDNSVLDALASHSQHASDTVTPDTLISGAHGTPEPFDPEGSGSRDKVNMEKQVVTPRHQRAARQASVSHASTTEEESEAGNDNKQVMKGRKDREHQQEGETLFYGADFDAVRTEDRNEMEEEWIKDEEMMEYKLYRLVAQSRVAYSSSTEEDDRLDGLFLLSQEHQEEHWEEDMERNNIETEGEAEELMFKLRQLKRQVPEDQSSSREDELDGVGHSKVDRDGEELAGKLCRLAKQLSPAQFSSSEDELDRVGEGEGEGARVGEISEEALWVMEADTAIQVSQLRNLASLVSASQFSSTEDELDRVGEGELGREGEMEETMRATEAGTDGVLEERMEKRESVGGPDARMLDFVDALGYEVLQKMEKCEDGREERGGTAEDVEDGGPCALGQDKPEDKEFEKCDLMGERAVKEIDRRPKKKVHDFVEARDESSEGKDLEMEKQEEGIKKRIDETSTQQGHILLHTQRSENSDGKEEERKAGGQGGGGEWKKSESDEYEEELEFNRIISSMLMLSQEETQVPTSKKESTREAWGTDEESEEREGGRDTSVEAAGESIFQEEMVGEPRGNLSQPTGDSESEGKGDPTPLERERDFLENRGAKHPSFLLGDICSRRESEDASKNGQRKMDAVNEREQNVSKKRGREEAANRAEGGKIKEEEAEQQRVEELWDDGAGEEKGSKETGETPGEKEGGHAEDLEQTISSEQDGILSPQEIQNHRRLELDKAIQYVSTLLHQRYSAVSLRSLTTEVLKVLNATEQLLQGVEGGDCRTNQHPALTLPPDADPKKLDQQFSRLEENVYVAAGSVFGLEVELGDLEECARGIGGATSDRELCFLEEQVASAAAKVQQSELQISDISARIAALKSAGLNVDPQSRVAKSRTLPVMPATLDSSRQLRRRLPATPVKEKES